MSSIGSGAVKRSGVRARTVAITVVVAVALSACCAGPAFGSVVVGQLGAGAGVCTGTNSVSFVQLLTAAGSSYAIPPGGGVITRWRTTGSSPNGARMRLETFQGNPVPGTTLTLTAQGDPHLIANDGGLGKSFEERLSVAGGDMLGFAVEAGDVTGCSVSAIAADRFTDGITPALGVPAPFAPAIPNVRLNLQADLEADADKDGFGDETQDSCPGQGTTHAVCATQIDSGPPNKTKAKKVTFAFSVPGGNAGVDGFECQTDGGSFASCSSPFVVRKLKPGRHAFRVHAVGSRGAGPDATDSFRVTKPKKKKK